MNLGISQVLQIQGTKEYVRIREERNDRNNAIFDHWLAGEQVLKLLKSYILLNL